MIATVVMIGAGVVAIVIGITKPIAPLIELGAALVVIAYLAKPKSES